MKRILKYMAELNTIRKFVSYIDTENTKQGLDDVMIGLSADDPQYGLSIEKEEAIKNFAEKHNTSRYKIEKICSSAIKLGYLELAHSKYVHDKDKLSVTHDLGLNLIQKLWFIPTGFIREFLNENGRAITIVSAIIVAIGTTINVIIEVRK